MIIRVLGNKKLAPFLVRHMSVAISERDLRLDDFLRLALIKANEFVPSQSGSIFLDDPASKATRLRERNYLSAVACFGPKSSALLGRRIAGSRGIVGRVYVSGQPYFSKDVKRDPHFASEFDRFSGHLTRSILCVPISIRGNTVGVLELINKKARQSYTAKDFELLKIFADYISASIQNFLDARRHADLAKRDNLTGLSNDRQLHTVLKREVTRAWRSRRELGLLFIDLDRFKEVNDVHGHLAGSRVLIEVAQVLTETVHWPRAEIARYGGDEYVIILPDVTLSEALRVAEDVRRAIERKVFLDKSTPEVPAHHIADQITASIGAACLLTHAGSNDRNLLLKAADDAMYAAKRAGKNQVCLASTLRAAGARVRREVTQ